MGSDAPVAPLDPWLAMAAAVHRAAPGQRPWHPEQSLTPAEALAASTDGRPTLAVGEPLRPFDDPADAAAHLRAMNVAATFVAGRATHCEL